MVGDSLLRISWMTFAVTGDLQAIAKPFELSDEKDRCIAGFDR